MSNDFCFRVYRSAALLSFWLSRKGAYRLSEAVYWFLPLKLCKVGFDVWSVQHAIDFEAYLTRAELSTYP